jgi:D-beta-D-heptose 7-phosphate kinase / D-beta-D-heptose 1-phosphate adenosyltransferase
MGEHLLIIGDALLEGEVEGRGDRPAGEVPVVAETEARSRPGGAGLAATVAAAAGIEVTLVTALGSDRAGRELARALLLAGVDLVDLGLDGATPEKVRVLDRGRPVVRLDRGGGRPLVDPGGPSLLPRATREAAAILVSDHGGGIAALSGVRAALATRPAGTPLVWSPHPDGPKPIAGADLVATGREQALGRCRRQPAEDLDGAGRLALELRRRWDAFAVVVSCGTEGAALASGGAPIVLRGESIEGEDHGAEERFAIEAAWTLARGGDLRLAVSIATGAMTAFIVAGGARGIDPPRAHDLLRHADLAGIGEAPLSIEPALRRAAEVRRGGGIVVATGGCFDLLHTGHLQTLRTARGLGDCLLVLLNDNGSARRLKGPGRPVVDELERAELLAALDCVDEVVIVDEETPFEALSLLHPEIWVKAGDHTIGRLPERKALTSWGGRVVLLPSLAGKSTTSLIEQVGHRP